MKRTFPYGLSMRGVCAIALSALIAGCGGGSRNSSGFAGAIAPDNVSVTLPPGYTPPSGGLSLSGGLFSNTAVANGAGMVKAWDTGRELVGVVDSSGNPILLAWIGDGNNAINARTTADVLTYFAIEGFAAPNENQDALVTGISQDSGGDKIASDITADLASGKNLGSTGVTFAADLQTYATSLIGVGNGSSVRRALVSAKSAAIKISPDPSTPGGTQSGITINSGTATDSITATNAFRRRVLLFVDRNNTFDGSTPPVTTNADIQVSEQEITPATGGVNGSGVVSNLSGAIGNVTTSPIQLPAVPSPQFGATYDVVAVGAGTTNATPPLLSTSELADKDAFLKKSFFLDFFLPVLNRICISNTLTQTQTTQAATATIANQMDIAATTQSAGVVAFVDSNFPNAESQMQNGDFLGATNSVLSTLNSNSKTYAAVVSYYSSFLQTAEAGNPNFTANSSTLSGVTLWMSKALTNVNVSSLPVSLPQYQGVAQSNEYSSWTITQTTGAVVSLTPSTSTITTTVGSDTQNLTAAVNFGSAGQPAGSTLLYSWTTPGAHGDMVFPDNTNGTTSELNSTFDTTEYFADLVNQNNNGTDIITVSVSLKPASGPTVLLGTATASVTVNSGTMTGSGFGTNPPPGYTLRSKTGTLITVTGGAWGASDSSLTGPSFQIFADQLLHLNGLFTPDTTEGFNDLNLPNDVSVTTVYLANEVPNPNIPVNQQNLELAQSGDTITVIFDCPQFLTPGPGYASQTSIGIDQDVYLFSPTGQNLGIVIPKFTSAVGGSDGAPGEGGGGGSQFAFTDWLVTRTVKIP